MKLNLIACSRYYFVSKMSSQRCEIVVVDDNTTAGLRCESMWMMSIGGVTVQLKRAAADARLKKESIIELTAIARKGHVPEKVFQTLSTQPLVEMPELLKYVLGEELYQLSQGVHTAFQHRPSKLKGERKEDMVQGFFRMPIDKLKAVLRASGTGDVIIQIPGGRSGMAPISTELVPLPSEDSLQSAKSRADSLGELSLGVCPLRQDWSR